MNTATSCLVCGEDLQAALTKCLTCETVCHLDCAQYAGKCAVYGCESTHFLDALIIPHSRVSPLSPLRDVYLALREVYPTASLDELCHKTIHCVNGTNLSVAKIFRYYITDREKIYTSSNHSNHEKVAALSRLDKKYEHLLEDFL